MLANPKSGIDIEKNKRNANKNNPIINRMVPRLINPVFIFYTSSKIRKHFFFKNILLAQQASIRIQTKN